MFKGTRIIATGILIAAFVMVWVSAFAIKSTVSSNPSDLARIANSSADPLPRSSLADPGHRLRRGTLLGLHLVLAQLHPLCERLCQGNGLQSLLRPPRSSGRGEALAALRSRPLETPPPSFSDPVAGPSPFLCFLCYCQWMYLYEYRTIFAVVCVGLESPRVRQAGLVALFRLSAISTRAMRSLFLSCLPNCKHPALIALLTP